MVDVLARNIEHIISCRCHGAFAYADDAPGVKKNDKMSPDEVMPAAARYAFAAPRYAILCVKHMRRALREIIQAERAHASTKDILRSMMLL